jgi:hypothetical protein
MRSYQDLLYNVAYNMFALINGVYHLRQRGKLLPRPSTIHENHKRYVVININNVHVQDKFSTSKQDSALRDTSHIAIQETTKYRENKISPTNLQSS